MVAPVLVPNYRHKLIIGLTGDLVVTASEGIADA